MSSSSSSSEHSDFNFNHSLTSPLSSRYSNESDTSLDFTPFDYLTTSNNILSDPPLHEDDEVFMWVSEEELFLSHLTETCFQACPLMLEARFLDTDRRKSLIETIHSGSFNEQKNPQKQEYDEEISDEEEDPENEDDESAYDGDDDKD